jgi:Txe/YoeB family toxin of Txe-Axe toxin-antitoxin module
LRDKTLGHWRQADAKVAARIDKIIEEIARDPFKGIGKARTPQISPTDKRAALILPIS